MQYDKSKTKPKLIWKQQVRLFLESCGVSGNIGLVDRYLFWFIKGDVRVKMGLWERKFHRFVLVESPFFHSVLNNDFLEKQTGIIEIKLGTPATLEMAIMFLYGRRPYLRENTIEHLLHLAEFLLIRNLKSACVRWLNTVDITGDNCIKFMQLSSIFDFDFPACTEYIEAHLSEMLKHPQMVSLTFDSIKVLFKDRRLSYVSMDDKLKFLLKWKDTKVGQKTENFTELLATIDFNDVSALYFHELLNKQSLIETLALEQKIRFIKDSPDKHRVLVIKSERRDGQFLCWDHERMQWFQVHFRALQEESQYFNTDIAGQGNHEPEIYLRKHWSRQTTVLVVNLQSDSCRKIELVDKMSGEDFQNFENLKLIDDLCVLNVNQRVQKNRERSEDAHSFHSRRQMQHPFSLYYSAIEPLCRSLPDFIDTSTIYKGVIANGSVQMSPLLTIKDDTISQMCIGKNLDVALLFNSNKRILLYDLVAKTLEKLDIFTDSYDKLCPIKDGFVIYNNQRCLCLTRLNRPSLSTKYVVKNISFKCEQLQFNKYFLCGETWYHFYLKKNNSNMTLEFAFNSNIISQPSTKNVHWKPLTLPNGIHPLDMYNSILYDKCFEMFLPKSRLRCDIDCPHCEASTMYPSISSLLRTDSYLYEEVYDHISFIGDYYYGCPFDDTDYFTHISYNC